MVVYKTASAQETKEFGRALAIKFIRERAHPKNALAFALSGDLGSGKTTFVQGFLRGLGVRGSITSPTFVLMKKFAIRVNPRFNRRKSAFAYHIDCYRIKKSGELTKLGLKEILNNPQNIVLIEWAEKIKEVLPRKTIRLKFEHGKKENQRAIRIKDR